MKTNSKLKTQNSKLPVERQNFAKSSFEFLVTVLRSKFCVLRWRQRRSFSLIEVLLAITILILVGVAMASLNNAAARLTEVTELKQMALGLNEQSLAFVALKKRTMGADPITGFAATYPNCVASQTCYVVCPTGSSGPSCPLQLQVAKATLQVGTSKLQFVPLVIIRQTGTSYLVNATVSWGKGVQRQLTTARIIE